MKPLMSAVTFAALGVLSSSGQDKSWRLGPYDKVIPQQRPSITNVFSVPPPPALRGAIVFPSAQAKWTVHAYVDRFAKRQR